MLKMIVPSLLLAGAAATSAQAADPVIGFEFGTGYHLFNESRITNGGDVNFALELPVGTKFTVGVYHETGRYQAKENGTSNNIRADINELRFKANIWSGDTQSVDIFLGMGEGDFNFNGIGTSSTPVADLGVDYDMVKTVSGPVHGNLGLNANYRYARVDDVAIGGGFTSPINDLSGFVIGLHAGLYF